MKRLILSLVCLLFVGCEPAPKYVAECPKCDHTKQINNPTRGMRGPHLPTVFCPNDGSLLVWRQLLPKGVHPKCLECPEWSDCKGGQEHIEREKDYQDSRKAWNKERAEENTVLLEGRCIWNSEYRVHMCDYTTELRVKIKNGGICAPNVSCPICLSEIIWYTEGSKKVRDGTLWKD